MPRTITSTASGSALRNAFSRRVLRKLRPQRGRPKPAANARPSAPSKPPMPPSRLTKTSYVATGLPVESDTTILVRPAVAAVT